MPEITVLMPVYNGEKYLRPAIESILNQTFSDFEFLIINDGSTDNSESIILSYKDERIRYVKNENNLKLIKTLNKGISLSRGKYIARMDCDDISFPIRFEKQIEALRNNPELDGVCGRSYDLYHDLSIRRNLRFLPLHSAAFRFISQFEVSFIHPSLMVKTAVLQKEPFKDDESALNIEDMELGSRLSSKGYNIENLNTFLIYYRKNIEGVCFTHRDEQKHKSFKLAHNNLLKSFSIDMTEDFYQLLTEKKGFNSLEKLNNAIKCLNSLKNTFFIYNRKIDKKNKYDINSWVRIRKFSFLISALKELSLPYKLIVVVYLLSNIGFCLDPRFVEAIKIWFFDWGPFSKKKYLSND